MQVFLTTLVQENLVDRLSQEGLVESTDYIVSISLIHDLNEVLLLQKLDALRDYLV